MHKILISYLNPSKLRRARTFSVIKNTLHLKVKYSKYSDNTAETKVLFFIFLISLDLHFEALDHETHKVPLRYKYDIAKMHLFTR